MGKKKKQDGTATGKKDKGAADPGYQDVNPQQPPVSQVPQHPPGPHGPPPPSSMMSGPQGMVPPIHPGMGHPQQGHMGYPPQGNMGHGLPPGMQSQQMPPHMMQGAHSYPHYPQQPPPPTGHTPTGSAYPPDNLNMLQKVNNNRIQIVLN